MFEVDPNLWLQSFASPALHWLMMAISTLGYEWFYIALIVALAFGLRLRPTLGVMLALLLAGVATHAAKTGFELPRPTDVDARVLHEGEVHVPLVAHGGADRFLALPSPQAREAIRAQADPDFGFISGHVAAATAMCLGLLLCFRIRRRAAWIALCAWPLLMGLSRMYLGRHFLGDILGGLGTGIVAALLAAWLLPAHAAEAVARRRFRLLWSGTAALFATALSTPLIDTPTLGRLAGLVIVLAALRWRGFPDDRGTLARRVARVACLCAMYFAVKIAMQWLGNATGWQDGNPLWLPTIAIATAVMFLGGIGIALRLRLFARSTGILAVPLSAA